PAIETNGGHTTRSTASTSPIEARSASASSTACSIVVFIFQLPATIGRRRAATSAPRAGERGHAGQHLALDELQRRAAAGRDVAHSVGYASRLDRRDQIAAADDRGRVGIGERTGEIGGPLCELGDLVGAEWPVPQH